jgi:UrcA family protein
MVTKRAFISAWPILGAAIVACSLIAGSVAAKDVTVAIRVSARGLDLSQHAGAHEFYSRLKHAAKIVCTHGMRVGLQPAADQKGCYEKALGSAVRSANSPLLTQVYLQTHTPQEATALGIDVPVQVAAK